MSIQRLLSMKAPPFPLSSRAKPRDLRFSGPLLEMFFRQSKSWAFRPTQEDEIATHSTSWCSSIFDRAYPDFLHCNCKKRASMRLSAERRRKFINARRDSPTAVSCMLHDAHQLYRWAPWNLRVDGNFSGPVLGPALFVSQRFHRFNPRRSLRRHDGCQQRSQRQQQRRRGQDQGVPGLD
jgi:hypothetical protein